jgi:hypothetical protein
MVNTFVDISDRYKEMIIDGTISFILEAQLKLQLSVLSFVVVFLTPCK